jgi:hypothetical protein
MRRKSLRTIARTSFALLAMLAASQYGPAVRVNTGGFAERVNRILTLPRPQSLAARDGICSALHDRN